MPDKLYHQSCYLYYELILPVFGEMERYIMQAVTEELNKDTWLYVIIALLLVATLGCMCFWLLLIVWITQQDNYAL